MGGARCRIRAAHLAGHALLIAGSRQFSSAGQTLAAPMRPVHARVEGSRVFVPSRSSEVDDRAGQRSHDALNGLDRCQDELPDGIDVFGLNEHYDVVGSGDCIGGDHAGLAAHGSGDVGCSTGVGLDQDVRSKNRCLLIWEASVPNREGRRTVRYQPSPPKRSKGAQRRHPAQSGCRLKRSLQRFEQEASLHRTLPTTDRRFHLRASLWQWPAS